MARGKRSSLFLQIILLLQLAGARELQECGSCIAPVEFLPDYHKSIYTIGVLAIQGAEAEASYDAYKPTFTDYLTATAGKRFDPPINFEMVDLDYQTMYDLTESQEIDFLFVSPSPSACLAAQYGTQSLASITKKAVKDGVTYNLSEFGGLIITQADNENINSVEDLRDKTVAAVSIAGFGSGLMQFYEMQKRGMSYINDPNALIFTSNQAHVVQGVLDGTFEAGFVRTGIIERALDADGNPVDASKLKIIESQQDLSDGAVYPYEHSTPLYPEWNIAALKQTSSDVAREVQAALLALSEHGRTGQALEACIAANDNDSAQCNDLKGIDPLARCDTTVESAKAASRSLSDGMYAGWRTTLSYNEIRTLLEDTGFIQKDPVSNVWRCQPPSNLYDQIVCPPNFFKLSFDAYNASCPEAGLTCPNDYECVCRPCFEAAAIEISLQDTYKPGEGCPKMSVCGTLEQNDVITYTVADNLEAGLDLRVNVLEGSDERQVPVEAGSQTNTYSFSVSSTRVGIMILEIFNGEEQIEASPLRVNVAYRTCPSGGRANENGNCDCGSKTYSIGGKCVERWILYVGIFVPFLTIGSFALYWFVKGKDGVANSLFLVKPSELEFSDPPNIIGRGSFGFVLQAEYRGSKVAVKRVIPPKKEKKERRESLRFGYNARGIPPAISTAVESTTESPNNSTVSAKNFDVETGRRASTEEKRSKLSLNSNSEGEQPVPMEKVYVESDIEVEDEDDVSIDIVSNPELNLNADVSSFSSMEGDEPLSAGSSSSILNVGFPNLMASTESRIIDLNEDGLVKPKKKKAASSEKKSLSKLKLEFIEEMRILSRLRHPNITTVMGAVIEKGTDPMLIMEFMEHGSLQEVLLNPTVVIESDLIWHILKDIAQGVRFLHSSDPPVIHGDLKSGNVLIDSNFRAKLSDFGLSKRKPDKATGTPLWMAPELLSGQSMNTPKSDMYSVGIIMYSVFSRKEPYHEATESNVELLRAIVDRRKSKRPRIPPYCPMKVKKLIKFLWHADPALRPSARELDNRLQEMDAKVFDSCALAERGHLPDKPSLGDHFLYQAFPRHVADVLKAGGKMEPESHDNITIFFSDIVGFTTIASEVEPLKVSQMLDRLYTKFDNLSRKYDVFKVETIGDAYMCAGNLAQDQQNDHVKRIALFAIDAIQGAAETLIDEDDTSRGYVKIRVGFHSGPVVSNVVGSLNPRYGVFGDTVNVAARMESNSEEGRIHCSKASAKQLMIQAPDLPVILRGEMQIKGKGKMTTYWVG